MRIFSIFFLLISMGASSFELPNKKDFFFGVANAPTQVEDGLHDTWNDHVRDGGVRAFLNEPNAENKNNFWSDPETELDLAQELGIGVFRLGIDWQRVMPERDVVNEEALKRYDQIFDMIRSRGMKIMLTLFHHSEPRYTLSSKSFLNSKNRIQFEKFSKLVIDRFGKKIDYLVTFNEANVYVLLGMVGGLWPSPFIKAKPLGILSLWPFKGKFDRAMRNVAKAHTTIYTYTKKLYPKILVGVAHNIADYEGKGFINKQSAALSNRKMNFGLFDQVSSSMDFIGINYYGTEVVKGTGIQISPSYQYSDSGRAISPKGFYKVIKSLNKRYNVEKKGRKDSTKDLPFLITENGVADQLDIFRGSYWIEHLAVINQVMKEGMNVLGYITWTLTDNFEWADGYCPKFGMVAIDRANNYERTKRDSFYLFKKLISERSISESLRQEQWNKVEDYSHKLRPFCRSKDGKTALDKPVFLELNPVDWRFRL